MYIASIVMMIRGAFLNVAAFTGNNYLAKYLSGDWQAVLDEKPRHGKAFEACQATMAKFTLDGTKLLD